MRQSGQPYRSRNLDRYSAANIDGRGYGEEYQSRFDSNDAELEHVPDLCRNGRFWIISSLALFTLIIAILLASLVRTPRCPHACQNDGCIIDVQQPNGDIREKRLDCTCHTDLGLMYCANKEQSSQDKYLSAISTLCFVLFFIILVVSCAFVRCLNRAENRVGLDEEGEVHPARAEVSVHNDANVYNVQDYMESGTTSEFSTPNSRYNAHNNVMNNIPIATISRKPNIPTAVAIPL